MRHWTREGEEFMQQARRQEQKVVVKDVTVGVVVRVRVGRRRVRVRWADCCSSSIALLFTFLLPNLSVILFHCVLEFVGKVTYDLND